MKQKKKDIWGVRGALKKYAKGKTSDWKKIRSKTQNAVAARTIKVLKKSKTR